MGTQPVAAQRQNYPDIHLYQNAQFRQQQAVRYFEDWPQGVESYHILVYCKKELEALQKVRSTAEFHRDHPYQVIFDKYTKPFIDWWLGKTPEERSKLAWKRAVGLATTAFFLTVSLPAVAGTTFIVTVYISLPKGLPKKESICLQSQPISQSLSTILTHRRSRMHNE